MSARPIEQKKRRRVAKALRRQPAPTYFDLWQWLIDHGHAKSRREAKDIIIAKRVRSDSHVLAVSEEQVMVPSIPGVVKLERKPVARQFVSTDMRPGIVVLPA